MQVHGWWAEQHPLCLAVSGSKLVSGSNSGWQGEVHAWGLDNLDLQHKLHLPSDVDVQVVLAEEGVVWAGVGMDVVVWGRWA